MTYDTPSMSAQDPVIHNPWARLRRFTDARIGLGRAGVSIPTQQLLDFQLAHAQAQDAVHKPLNIATLLATLPQSDSLSGPPLQLTSAAKDRAQYLQRPDLGRHLDTSSASQLHKHSADDAYDIAIAIVDGLSALAIETNAGPFLNALLPVLGQDKPPWHIAPLCIVEQGRVAIGDDIAQGLHARCVLVLIGERPGLSSPDSMGIYLTWHPGANTTDAGRNCISNVRPAGLDYTQACQRTHYLLTQARIQRLSGVALKDRSTDANLPHDPNQDAIAPDE